MGKSSKDKRDAYYRLAKEQGWRARSAFKLLQLDEEFDLFANVTRVVDLCAAPGSWSQVLSRVLIKGEKFGRTAWEEKDAKLQQHMLKIFGVASSPKVEKDEDAKLQQHMQEILGVASSPKVEKDEGPQEDQSKEQELKPRKDVKIVAIDLQPMSPLEGIVTLRADITHPATIPLLLKALDPTYVPSSASQQASHPVDLVLSDGAPDVTGLHDLDIYVQSQLLFAALNVALCVLKPGGKFVAKIFRGRNVDLLFAQLKIFFERVIVSKPRSSRASSVEAFIVCLNFQPPGGFKASLEEPLGVGSKLSDIEKLTRAQNPIVAPLALQNSNGTWSIASKNTRTKREDGVVEIELGEEEAKRQRQGRWIAPFLACGDLSAFDADASYHLPKNRITLDPVQPPTAPPYKRALEMRKAAGGAYGKTAL